MKNIIITVFLLIAATAVTIMYFRSINSPNHSPIEIMGHIPDDAAIVAELSNDEGFYEAFNDTKVLAAIGGEQKTKELRALRKYILENPSLKEYFINQHIYISVHPTAGNETQLLITTAVNKDFNEAQLFTAPLKATLIKPGSKNIYEINIPELGRPFFIAQAAKRVLAGSFSKALVENSVNYAPKNYKSPFLQISDQQRSNSLAILYINQDQLQPLFQQLFINKNPDLFRSFRLLHSTAALSLNYRTDALMFNGLTQLDPKKPVSYLNLFALQQPVVNHLKDIFPATTAYSISFAVSNPKQFIKDLDKWEAKAGISNDEKALYRKIKSETGINISHEVDNALGNEFAVVTTRFKEKLAIIEIKNGQMLFPALANISTMSSENIGQFNYSKLPFYLLGDVFGIFNKPYFTITNNYLILANTASEITAYTEAYANQKFLSKTEAFNQFDDLLSERSNAAFFINFKNAKPVLRRDLKPAFYKGFENSEPGLTNYYAASYQLISSDQNFYTNFCMRLAKPDTTDIASNK